MQKHNYPKNRNTDIPKTKHLYILSMNKYTYLVCDIEIMVNKNRQIS